MEALVEGGLLDRILKTPDGGVIRLEPSEVTRIVDACVLRAPLTNGVNQILTNALAGRDFQFLGRTVQVKPEVNADVNDGAAGKGEKRDISRDSRGRVAQL